MDVRVGLWRKLSAEELMLLNCGVGEDSWESLGLQGDPSSPFLKAISPGISLEGMMLKLKLQYFGHLMRRVDSLEKTLMLGGMGVGGEGDGRGWDGWMASLTRWMRVWVNSGSWWWTGRPGVLQFMGSQRVGHNWVTELNWTELMLFVLKLCTELFRWQGSKNDWKQEHSRHYVFKGQTVTFIMGGSLLLSHIVTKLEMTIPSSFTYFW